MVVIADRAQQREQNMLDQRFKLAWAHWKVEAAVRDYLRRPLNRLWDSSAQATAKHRRKPTRVQFEGALCADIRVLINVSPASQYQKPASSIRIDAPESYVTRSRQCRAECNLAHSGANQVQCRQAQGSASDSEAHSD